MKARIAVLLVVCCGYWCGCRETSDVRPDPIEILYVGSSTIAQFIRDADALYPAVRFVIDSEPESYGGDLAIRERRADLAGFAGTPQRETLAAGISSELIGRDAIAVILHPENPVKELSLSQLAGIFSGKIRNWRDVGGADRNIEAFIVGERSATRKVFRSAVLGENNFVDCQTVTPDNATVGAVSSHLGGIGHISFSFLSDNPSVKTVRIDGEEADVTNFDYPIARELHLLYRKGESSEVDAFIQWARSREGQRVVMKRFVGVRVGVALRQEVNGRSAQGSLIVYTETSPYYDGGIWYYPHRGYDILTRHGAFLRSVRNHRGRNDEKPMKVRLDPGTYLVRPHARGADASEFFVKIEVGKVTEVVVSEVQGGQQSR